MDFLFSPEFAGGLLRMGRGFLGLFFSGWILKTKETFDPLKFLYGLVVAAISGGLIQFGLDVDFGDKQILFSWAFAEAVGKTLNSVAPLVNYMLRDFFEFATGIFKR